MKKIYFLLQILLASSVCCYAQNQSSWQWAKRGGGLSGDNMLDMATDKYGNIYALTFNIDSIDIDGQTGLGSGDQISLVSWDCNGNYRWMKMFGGTGTASVRAAALATDTLGGVYVTGAVHSYGTDALYFHTDTTITGTMAGLYIIKYSSAGVFQWFKMPWKNTANVTDDTAASLNLSVSPDGRVFWYAYLMPGSYDGNAFSISQTKYYAVEYNASGVYQQKHMLDMNTTRHAGIDLYVRNFNRDYQNGRMYVTGQYYRSLGILSFGSSSVVSADSANIFPMFIAAFDSLGNNLWMKQGNDSFTASVEGRPAIDDDGHVYIAGYSVPSNVFNGDTLTNGLANKIVPFVMALDSSGNKLWTSNGSTTGSLGSRAYAVTYANNTVGVTGDYSGQLQWDGLSRTATNSIAFFARFNAATGSIIGLDTINSGSTAYTSAITVDRNSNFYIGGSFGPTLLFPGNTLTALGYFDWFVAKYGGINTCTCNLPQPAYTSANSGNTYNFTYTGTTPYLSINWTFGDGGTASNTTTPSHNFTTIGNYPVCVTTEDGCGFNTACHYINITTGINDITAFAATRVYPNPATTLLTVENAGVGTKLEVYDVVGKLMQRTKLERAKEQIDISHLSPGMYLLRFTTRDGQQGNVKFVKE